jgi:hypothetical protein
MRYIRMARRILIGKLEGWKTLGNPRIRWGDIKWILEKWWVSI